MRHHILLRRFALVFALAIALTIGLFVRGSAAAPVYFVHGSSTALCDKTGSDAQADFQGGFFGSELHGFWDREHVTVSFTFPDGRQFSPIAASLLDGVVDLPPNYTTAYQTDVAGDLYFEYPITNKWPYGCYKLTAVGDSSGQVATGYLLVAPRGVPQDDPGPARLAVWNNGTFDSFAVHNSLVNIHGVNFFPNEVISVWITQPDGTVLDYPQQVASDAGNFESTFQFTGAHQTGHYTFTALGTRSGYQVFAPFELRSNTSVPSGWATLRVAYPFPSATSQNGSVSIAGSLFSPGEPVGIWLTLPNNAVRGLPNQLADGNGDFYTVFDIDERLPTGHYSVTAKGVDSGRLVISGFDVAEGDFQGLDAGASQQQAPAVTETNIGDGTLGGPTNLEGAEHSPGPEITPPDSGAQGCSVPGMLWTPNC